MAETQEDSKGLNILCIDGGGVRGLSSLLLLAEMTNRLHGLGDTQRPLPLADHFDVIAGTGTGGIIACMLGRLRMSMEDAMEAYIKLAKSAFSKKLIGTSGPAAYKGTKLQEALKTMIRDATGDQGETIRDRRMDVKVCKTMVFAMSRHNIAASAPVLFRSYPTSANETPNCSIWEALYASMAHPDLFKAIEIQDGPIRQSFVGGELGCSNPTAHVLGEVKSLYPNRHVSCIMSIGAGHTRTIHIPKPSFSQRVLRSSTQTIVAVKNMATDSQRVSEEMTRRFQGAAQVYHRLNVDQGLQVVGDDWAQGSNVKAHTSTYLGKFEAGETLDRATRAIKQKANTLPVNYIDGSIQASSEQPVLIKACPAPTPVFTGRDDQVQQILNCVAENDHERRVCVVYGMGGAGKTQVTLKAIEVKQESWVHVLYVDASSSQTVEDTLRDFAKAKGFGQTHRDTLDWLGLCRESWLLVYDNADHPSLNIRQYFPRGDRGNIIVTTRLPDLAAIARGPNPVCRISSMSPEDGLALLLKLARLEDQTTLGSEMEAAHMLLKDFGFLALAIVHAGAYIAHSPHLSISRYRELFLARRKEMLEQYNKLKVKLDDYEKSVYTTWKMCYDLLEVDGDAKPLLWLISYPHHDDIRPELFQRSSVAAVSYEPELEQTQLEKEALDYIRDYLGRFLDADGSWDIVRFLNAISELASYSLLDFDRINQAYHIHVLVQDWARTVIPQSQNYALECTTLLLSLSIDSEDTSESLGFARRLKNHVERVLLERGNKLGVGHAGRFANVYIQSGNWDKAEKLQAQLREGRRRELGDLHPSTLASANDLALTYQNQGRWDAAKSLQEDALSVHFRLLGGDHADTLTIMGNLAATYQGQGRWDEAELMQQEVLKAQFRLLVDEDPGTLASMNNLATTFQKKGQWDRAESLQNIVLSERKRLLGEEHPDTLISMNNLAATYQNQGRWDEAEALQGHVMGARKRLLGEEHPSTLTCMNNLALTYQSQGRWSQAESLQGVVLTARKRILGEEHPNTIASLNNLAVTYQNQGRWDKAEAVQKQVLSAQERLLGQENPDTLNSMNNLAFTYQNQGRWGEAESLQDHALSARERLLGQEHPDTLISMNNLALTYQNQGRWDKAEALHGRVLSARRQLLGEEHPDTLKSMSNLAATYQNQGQWNKAESLQGRVGDAQKRLLGEEHPDTLTSMSNLALTYQNQGQLDKAEALQEHVWNAQKRLLGEEHYDTLVSMSNLAFMYQKQGRWDKAETLQDHFLDAQTRLFGQEHPRTLDGMHHLAVTYHNQGRWGEAELLHGHTLSARKRLLGEEHPDTLISMNNLAFTYQKQGRWGEAESLHDCVLDARKRLLGEEHHDTLLSMDNLALTYQNQGRWGNAEALQDRVLSAQKRLLGQEHPKTLFSMHNLAVTYQNQGRWDEVEALRDHILSAQMRLLGEEHSDTLTSMNNLAFTYQNLGRWDKAESLQGHLLSARERLLGEEHPDTLVSMNLLAATYQNQGRCDEAKSLLTQVLNLSDRGIGLQHPIAEWAKQRRETIQSQTAAK